MPKSAKKKKDKVADFSRAKLKLGKGKAPASNAIDTSFKARSIALPSQSITVEKDGSEPLTKRQLNFGDLLSHLKHHNAGTKKDAILGLRELLDSNWGMLDSSLTQLLNALVRLIGDEDAGVRKQLLVFFAWLLPKIPADQLAPHSPLLLLFTTSAQTHIFPEIRIDAIRFLDILLECIPECVIVGWSDLNGGHGSRVLEGYLGVLNAGTKYGETDGPLKATSTSSVVLTPASKLVVLRSLSTFLHSALLDSETGQKGGRPPPKNSNKPLDASFMKNVFPSVASYQSFESLLGTSSGSGNGQCRTWQAEVETEDDFRDVFTQAYSMLEGSSGDPWTLQSLCDSTDITSGTDRGSGSTTINFVAHLANTLHSTVIETYLDCAPSVFSPNATPSETEVQLILSVARITRTLYHAILRSSSEVDAVHFDHLESIVNYMAPYFPTFTKDSRVEQAYEEFNLIFCELTSLLVTASEPSSSRLTRNARRKTHSTASRKGKAPSSSTTIQTERVTEYIIRRLRGEGADSVPSPSSSSISSGTAVPITYGAYLALLPTIWALISNPASPSTGKGTHEENKGAGGGGSFVSDMLHATLDHAIKVASKSACKRATVEFVARLMLLDLEPHFRLECNFSKDPAVKLKFEAWLLHLPQVLWEVGGNNISSAEIILRVLLRVLQRRLSAVQSDSLLTSLQSRLVPYFHIDHPTRGPLGGPFRKLPSAGTGTSLNASSSQSASGVRLLALDVVAMLLAMDQSAGNGHPNPRGKEGEALLRAVGLAVAGEEEVGYWEQVVCSSKATGSASL